MLTVNGEQKYVLNLNEYSNQNLFELTVESYDGDSMLNWGIDSTLCAGVTSEKELNLLKLDLNVESIKNVSYIVLKNTNGEMALIKIIPDEDEIGEKVYVFKTGKIEISGRTTTIVIVSKRNNKNWNWNVSYDGEPISYEFKTTKTKLIINNVDNFDEAALGYISLSQYKSNKKIKIWLRHKTCEETEIDNIEEAD